MIGIKIADKNGVVLFNRGNVDFDKWKIAIKGEPLTSMNTISPAVIKDGDLVTITMTFDSAKATHAENSVFEQIKDMIQNISQSETTLAKLLTKSTRIQLGIMSKKLGNTVPDWDLVTGDNLPTEDDLDALIATHGSATFRRHVKPHDFGNLIHTLKMKRVTGTPLDSAKTGTGITDTATEHQMDISKLPELTTVADNLPVIYAGVIEIHSKFWIVLAVNRAGTIVNLISNTGNLKEDINYKVGIDAKVLTAGTTATSVFSKYGTTDYVEYYGKLKLQSDYNIVIPETIKTTETKETSLKTLAQYEGMVNGGAIVQYAKSPSGGGTGGTGGTGGATPGSTYASAAPTLDYDSHLPNSAEWKGGDYSPGLNLWASTTGRNTVGSYKGTVSVVDKAGTVLYSETGLSGMYSHGMFSRDDKWFAYSKRPWSSTRAQIVIVDTTTWTVAHTFTGDDSFSTYFMGWGADGMLYVNKNIKINPVTGGRSSPPFALSDRAGISQNGKWIISGRRHTVSILEVLTGTTTTFTTSGLQLEYLHITNDGKRVAIGEYTMFPMFYFYTVDYPAANLVSIGSKDGSRSMSAAWTPDGEYFIWGSVLYKIPAATGTPITKAWQLASGMLSASYHVLYRFTPGKVQLNGVTFKFQDIFILNPATHKFELTGKPSVSLPAALPTAPDSISVIAPEKVKVWPIVMTKQHMNAVDVSYNRQTDGTYEDATGAKFSVPDPLKATQSLKIHY